MRTVKSILNELDGIEFQANIAVINGLNHLIAVIDNDPMLVELQEAAINDSKALAQIVSNLHRKLAEPFDEKYVHPHDFVIAISIHILHKAKYKNFKQMMVRISTVSNMNWGYLMVGKYYKD